MSNILFVVMYLIHSYAMAKIGKKFGIGTPVAFFIPIYNFILACRCAGVSAWWTLGLFVPFVNLAVIVYVNGKIAKRLGKNAWLFGFGALLFGLSAYVMAWDKSMPCEEQTAQIT